MQVTWSQPVAEIVVFSNDFAKRGAAEMAMGDFDAPGIPDGAKPRLLVVPADPPQFEVVVPAERAGRGRGRGDPTVHADQLEPLGDAHERVADARRVVSILRSTYVPADSSCHPTAVPLSRESAGILPAAMHAQKRRSGSLRL